MPPDPFADDPNDPASFLEPEEEFPLLSDEELLDLKSDLANVKDFRRLLEPRGIRGISMLCNDCDEVHYYDWDIIESNIAMLINHQIVPVHEPGAKPNPDEYVTWDYCLGYADAMDYAFNGARPRFLWDR
ncbi:hypothetical protein GSS87_07200 [Corynebacterium sp. 4HC-13]|uniref:Uncharacterized protein n=1 Tax=Corynebacterium anserum TaxID=2684406 RepID=A0A7G7YRA0_9CORY|nr:hypothetical protein [Corynebacterium anserum]QNH97020.1 hypothetical protein GP473_07565 [Corynebacterium anserum]